MRRTDRQVRQVVGGEGGYTLTEMLVVIGIICLIAAVLTPGIVSQLGHARYKAAQLQLDTVASAVEVFQSDVGRYPTEAEGLDALIHEPKNVTGWAGPYIRDVKALTDPWNRPVKYIADGDDGFHVLSLGADGKPGGEGINRDLRAPAAAKP
jgi:general secretion pathway protein G